MNPGKSERIELQSIQKMSDMRQDQDWRLLAEQAAEEKDPTKLMEIIMALTRALDQQEERKRDQRDGIPSVNSTPGDRACADAGRPDTRNVAPK